MKQYNQTALKDLCAVEQVHHSFVANGAHTCTCPVLHTTVRLLRIGSFDYEHDYSGAPNENIT